MSFISSFKGRIVTVISLLLICALAISNLFAYRQLSSVITTDIDSYTQLSVATTSSKVSTWFDNIKQAVVATAPDFAIDRGDEQLNLMVKQINATTHATEILVGFEDGRSYSAMTGTRYVSDYDPRTRDWYRQAKQQGATIVTSIYTDALTNNLLVAIAEPFYADGIFKGVLLADIELTALDDIVNQSVYANATTSLYDNQGIAIASTATISKPGVTKLADNNALINLQQKMLNNANGELEHELNGSDQLSYFHRIELNDGVSWHLLITINKATHYAVIATSMKDALLSALVMTIIASLIVYFALNRLYRPILDLKATIVDLAQGNGDLTQRLAVTSQDDLGEIAQAVNQFIANLQGMMLEVSQASAHINSGIEQLTAQTEQNNQVLIEHASETEQVVVAITEMSSTADSVAQHAAQAATFTQRSTDESQQSKALVASAVDGVADLVNEVETMALNIQTMNDDTHKISAVLSVIGDIADQTNLLALNAAIEAARAGEQGRGFAVVADEVRVLAARTQQSTSEINEMLKRLRTGTDTVVTAMNITKASCQRTAQSTASVNDNLDSMANSVMEINDLGIQIATAAEEQSSVSEEINRNITMIQGMVIQLSGNGEKTMDSTRELASCNSQLLAIVGQFKLS